jgi:hypothetical protein
VSEGAATRTVLLGLRQRVEHVYTNYIGHEGRGGACAVQRDVQRDVLRLIDHELPALDRAEAMGRSLRW